MMHTKDPALRVRYRSPAATAPDAVQIDDATLERAASELVERLGGAHGVFLFVLLGVIGAVVYARSRSRSVSTGTTSDRVSPGVPLGAMASTTPTPAYDESYWAVEIPSQIRYWTTAADDDEPSTNAARRALGALFGDAGSAGFFILYDLLNDASALAVAETCVVLDALAYAQDPMVRRYRGRLIRDGLRHSSAAVRDAAALAIYHGRLSDEVPALLEARDAEPNSYARAAMTDILETLSK